MQKNLIHKEQYEQYLMGLYQEYANSKPNTELKILQHDCKETPQQVDFRVEINGVEHNVEITSINDTRIIEKNGNVHGDIRSKVEGDVSKKVENTLKHTEPLKVVSEQIDIPKEDSGIKFMLQNLKNRLKDKSKKTYNENNDTILIISIETLPAFNVLYYTPSKKVDYKFKPMLSGATMMEYLIHTEFAKIIEEYVDKFKEIIIIYNHKTTPQYISSNIISSTDILKE